MLFIDTKELREKGSIALLQNGALIEAIDKEMLKVLDDIEDITTNPKEKRKIKPELIISANASRTAINMEVVIAVQLAKRGVMQMNMNLEKAVDDDGHLLSYTLQQEAEEADGQQDIDGNEIQRETVKIPYHANAVEAEFTEKETDELQGDTGEKNVVDTETLESEENLYNEAEQSDKTENEAIDSYVDVEMEDFPNINDDTHDYF